MKTPIDVVLLLGSPAQGARESLPTQWVERRELANLGF